MVSIITAVGTNSRILFVNYYYKFRIWGAVNQPGGGSGRGTACVAQCILQ